MKKPAPVIFALLIALFHQATASVMLAPGTVLPGQGYIDYGAQFAASAVAIKRISTANNGTFGFVSGVQIDERHVLTAAHAIDTAVGFWPRDYLAIAIGSNLYSSSIDIGIKRMQVHESYGGTFGTGIDLVIFELESPIPGRGVLIAPDSAPNNTMLSFAAYGQHGLVDEPLQSVDGNLRAFTSTAIDPSSQFSNYFYGAADPFGSLTGKGANRDSGGGVYYNNLLVGLIIASSGGTSSSGFTTYLDVTRPEVKAFINAFRANSISPSVTVNIATNTAHLSFSGLIPTREYRIMWSSALSSWEEANRFTASGPTGSWSESLAPEGRRFYKLEWDE